MTEDPRSSPTSNAPSNPAARAPLAGRRLGAIRVAGKDIGRFVADSNPALWQRVLQSAYVAGLAPECLCQGQPVAMYIERRGDTHVLKRRPNSGPAHHIECDSHGGISLAAQNLYTSDAIRELADGRIEHTLSVPMSTVEHVNAAHTLDEVATPPRSEAQERRATMTLRGFMNLLWEEAGLGHWSPGMLGKRNLGLVYWRLREALTDRVLGGVEAQRRLYLPSTRLGEDADGQARREINERLDALQAAVGLNHRPILLILGELRSIIPTQRNSAVRLKGLPDNMPIWAPPASIERLRQQWPAPVERFTRSHARANAASETGQPAVASSNPNPRLMLLVGVQRAATGDLQWRYGAAMETTELWIPVDSSHEAVVANLLVDQKRQFHKPLRYDGDAATFPDFVLTDLGTDVPMEVYGFSGEAYEQRKLEKIAEYARQATPYWHWDVKAARRPPAFPTIHSMRAKPDAGGST